MKIFIYGIAGAEDQYRIVRYEYFDCDKEPITITKLRRFAGWMKGKYPGICDVYAVDESAQLARDFIHTWRAKRIDANVDFKCMLESIGLKILV